MKIYFTRSKDDGQSDGAAYSELVAHIESKGTLLGDGQAADQGLSKSNSEIWSSGIAHIREADAIVTEVTNPCLGVGYEIAKAEEWNKPVLALFRNDGTRKLSAVIAGSPNTKIAYYTDLDEAKLAIDTFTGSIYAPTVPYN